MLPDCVVWMRDAKEILCDTHGWVRIIRRAGFREIAGLPDPLPLPDIPPY